MTPERLAEIRAHFKNPPSASCNAQWGLELCDALEEIIATRPVLVPAFTVVEDPTMPLTEVVLKTSTEEVRIVNLAPPDAPVIIDDRPKKKAKK